VSELVLVVLVVLILPTVQMVAEVFLKEVLPFCVALKVA
jgi:hypothetical protein